MDDWDLVRTDAINKTIQRIWSNINTSLLSTHEMCELKPGSCVCVSARDRTLYVSGCERIVVPSAAAAASLYFPFSFSSFYFQNDELV